MLTAALLTTATGLASGCSNSQPSAGAVLPPGPTVTKTLVTLNLAEIEDCASLAAAVIPLWDSLGDLSAEEATKLDAAVVSEIGTYLEGIEQRRLAMGCDPEQWKADTCAALAGTSNPIATRFSDASC